MMKISIVILNWNRPEDTLDCLKSVEKCQMSLRVEDSQGLETTYRLQIIVIDNGSTDNSVALIKKQLVNLKKESGITSEIIENKENLGFAEGNNIGLKHALNHGADYVLLLNNDTIVDAGLINGLVSTARKYPKSGLLSPKIYFSKGYEFHKERYKNKQRGKVIWYAGGDFDWMNIYGSNHGVDEVDKGQFEKVKETDFATGACMLMRRKTLEDVGFFNKKYFMYLEDAEFSMRVKKAGWKVLYSPKGHLWHKAAQSSGIGSNLNDYFTTRNRLLFGMKYANIRTRFALYRESLRFLASGRKWQKIGVRDFYLRRFGRGSWK